MKNLSIINRFIKILLFMVFYLLIKTDIVIAVDTVKPPTRAFINPSFEIPVISDNSFSIFSDTLIAGWITTDVNHNIEIWNTPFNSVISQDLDQHTELNANNPSKLYQNVCFVPSDPQVTLSLYHRARQGTDTMRVLIDNVQSGANISTGTSAWVNYTRNYTPSVSQPTPIQIGFESVSTGSGNATVGNFLDNITLTGLSAFFELENATLSNTESTAPSVRIRINGFLASDQTINLSTSGTAVVGTDYTLPSTVNVPAGYYDGTSYITIPLTILNNNIPQGNRTINISISSSASLTIFRLGQTLCQNATPKSTINYTIIDDDSAEYGDAPDTYGTSETNATGYAYHLSDNNLRIGSSIDIESDGFPSVNADGDNNNATNDENGISSFNQLSASSTGSYAVNVNVTNSAGASANLIGWIDFNRNGAFEASEASNIQTLTSPNSNVSRTLTWTIPSNIQGGTSYVRIRLTRDSITSSEAIGAKSNGEVEDYRINILPKITGKVFDDINYGGGSGRSLVSSSGVGRPNVRVELYNSVGAFVFATLTDSNGNYTFATPDVTLTNGNYTVRVVNSSVKSSRLGTSSEIGVQTFRTNVSTGSVVDVTDHVGGQNPTLVDAGNGGVGTTMNTTTGVFTAGITGTAQSITNVNVLGTSDISGVDFGFNFDTIVNKNATGQGSLNQFIINSNVLDNAPLNQVGQTAGQEVSIFMIPNGVANAGQNTSYANQLNSYGAAQINLGTTPLANVTGVNTSIDGRTQTRNVRFSVGGSETNSGQSGTGGFVGVSQTYISKFDNPEIEILSNNIRGLTTTTTATGFVVRNIAFSGTSLIVNGMNSLIQDNFVSMNANGTQVASSVHSNSYCVQIGTGTSDINARHNYVKCNNSGIRRDNGGTRMTIEYNEVDRPSAVDHDDTYDGILIIGGGNDDFIQYNLVKNQRGAGSELGYNAGATVNNLTVKENTYTNNGKELDGSPSLEPLGIIVRTINDGSALTIKKNIIANNGGTGILVQDTRRVHITQNSIFRNGPTGSLFGTTANLGIDLRTGNNVDPNTMGTNIDGVTPNNGVISGTEANNGVDYPIITSATIKGTTLKVQGFVGIAPGDTDFANSVLEFFVAEDDGNNNGKVFASDNLNVGHGEGKLYIDSCTTNSTGDFNCTFNNVQSLVPGMFLTSTATNANEDTSEFSNLAITTEEPFLFYPNNADSALPGGTVYYTHEIISSESGNIQLALVTNKGWTYQVFRDVNGNNLLDGPDTLYNGGLNPSLGNVYNLNATHSVKLIVKGFVPEGVAINTVDNLTITATLTPTTIGVAPKSLDVQDVTTVSSNQGGSLKLLKSVSPTGNQPPNSNLTYTINFTNTGVATLKDIEIEDVVPAETTFVSASFNAGTTGTIVSPTVGQSGKITWTVTGNLTSGATGSVNFVVKIKP